jgi:hypothetical protein
MLASCDMSLVARLLLGVQIIEESLLNCYK